MWLVCVHVHTRNTTPTGVARETGCPGLVTANENLTELMTVHYYTVWVLAVYYGWFVSMSKHGTTPTGVVARETGCPGLVTANENLTELMTVHYYTVWVLAVEYGWSVCPNTEQLQQVLHVRLVTLDYS